MTSCFQNPGLNRPLGVSARNPKKYVLDEDELTRVSTLARTELEDARTELERVSKLAKTMGKDINEDDGDDQWEELSSVFASYMD